MMKTIAITGGPCAGKTTAMGLLREHLERRGIRALFVPEAATELILAGVAPWTCESMLTFQTQVIALQLEREQEAFRQAEACDALEQAHANETLVICDRGLCDSHAYLTDPEYRQALAANGIDQAQALARYDAVFHLESIATDNPRAYTVSNNAARFENAEEAALADKRVLDAWKEHPTVRVVGNQPDFDAKARVLFHAIDEVIGFPAGMDAENAHGPLLVSACLLGRPCRYDGKAQPCENVLEYARTRRIVPVCPEQLGGLPTPRVPSELQPDGRVIDASGADNTAAFEAGAQAALLIAREQGCTQAILKEKSPSCGVHSVYDGSFSGTLVAGSGKTAQALAQAGIELRSEVDLEPRSEADPAT